MSNLWQAAAELKTSAADLEYGGASRSYKLRFDLLKAQDGHALSFSGSVLVSICT